MSRRGLAITAIACVAVAASLLLFAAAADRSPETDVAKYEVMRDLLSHEAPATAVDALPQHIPSTVQNTRMWADIVPEEGRATLMLFGKVSPAEASRIAAVARERAHITRKGWRATEQRTVFYNPPWDRVVPDATLGHDLPGTYDIMLWENGLRRFGGLGSMPIGTNAGVLVDESKGSIVWWVQHWRAPAH